MVIISETNRMGRTICGLFSSGNSCYLNAALQLILAIPAFRQTAVQLFKRLEVLTSYGKHEDVRSSVLFAMCRLAEVKVSGRQDEVRDVIAQLRKALSEEKPQVKDTFMSNLQYLILLWSL